MTEEELKALADRFRQKLALDPEIRSLSKKIADGTADFSDTSKLFWRRSVMLREYTQDTVLDLAPEDRQRLVEALLHRGYDDTTEALTIVQEALDEAQGLHLNPVVPKYPAERVVQVAHALMDPTVPDEKIVRRAGAPVANVNMSFHDDYMKENAKIRAKLGFKCYLNRVAAAGCCKWCTDIAGRYVYGDQPDDVFRRHDNCGCTVTFENGRERQDVWSKRTWQASPLEVNRAGFKPVRNSRAQAAKINENALNGLTLGGQRDIIRSIDVDDYDTVTYGKGIAKEISKVILDTMKQCESDGGFIISEISTKVVPTSAHGTPILQIEPMGNGLLKLNVNANYLAGKTLAEVDEAFRTTETNVVNSLMEAVIHESGHAISIKGKTAQEIKILYQELRGAGLPGVSDIALADGAECLAELEVLRHRGTKVSDELAAFYKKYMGRDY